MLHPARGRNVGIHLILDLTASLGRTKRLMDATDPLLLDRNGIDGRYLRLGLSEHPARKAGNSQQADFEAAREHELRGVVLKMQCHARRFVVKCKYLRYRAILATIKDAIAARVLDRLEVCAGSRSAARRRP